MIGKYIMKPSEIEKRSFEIITERLGGRIFGEGRDDIIKRVIHTSADFDYADNMVFSDNAVEIMRAAIRKKCCIVTDTNMALQGINRRALERLGCEAVCFMGDADVAEAAEKRGITRAAVSMEKACTIKRDIIFAVGNAPTALIRIHELIKEGRIKPKGIIAVPVGFVNVIEAKEIIINGETPFIAARGNKGGSSIAAAICNALIYFA